jgi:hypothetical protein
MRVLLRKDDFLISERLPKKLHIDGGPKRSRTALPVTKVVFDAQFCGRGWTACSYVLYTLDDKRFPLFSVLLIQKNEKLFVSF